MTDKPIAMTNALTTTSTSSKDDMSKEQEGMMREWIIAKMPPKLSAYFQSISNVWDRNEIIMSCIKDLNYRDVVLVPKLNHFTDEIKYVPFFRLNSLATMLGYAVPANLFKRDKALHTHTKYTLSMLKDTQICDGQNGHYVRSIIPDHLDNKSDPRNNDYIYIDLSACEDLISAAMKQTKFKERAVAFKDAIDMIKYINDTFTNALNKEMTNYIAKLNQGTMPSTKEREAMKVICANASTHSNTSKSKDELSSEQESTMREWMVAQIDDKYRDIFKMVNKPWDKTEVLMSFFNTIKFKDIVLVPEVYGRRNKTRYVPWYSVTTLANMIGGRVDALKTKLLKPFEFMTISNLEAKYQPPQKEGADLTMIIPSHLKDNNYDKRLFINSLAALTLVRHVAHKIAPVLVNGNDVRSIAMELLTTMDGLDGIITDLVDDMSDLIAEYRHQQQAHALEATKQQLAAIEADKRQIEEQRKRLEEETKLLALKTYPDVALEKSHYGYIFSSDEYMAMNLYKIGITDNLKNREDDAHTYCPTGKFLYKLETYDARSTEQSLHRVLKRHGLHYKISSGNEWFRLPGLEEAKELLNKATNSTNDLYDHVATYLPLLRKQFTITNKPSVPMITDTPANPPPIADYVRDVTKKLINMNASYISKTNMIQLLKKTAHESKYKNYKAVLPIDLEAFIANDNIQGIRLTKKTTKKTMSISIDIESSDG